MKITVRGIRSLQKESEGVIINGATILTGANSSGKSSYALGLKLLSQFLLKQGRFRVSELMFTTIDTSEIESNCTVLNLSKDEPITIEIELNKEIGIVLRIVFIPIAGDKFECADIILSMKGEILSSRSSFSVGSEFEHYLYSVPIWNTYKFLSQSKIFRDDIVAIDSLKNDSKGEKIDNVFISTEKSKTLGFDANLYNSKSFSEALIKYFISKVNFDYGNLEVKKSLNLYSKKFFKSKNAAIYKELYSSEKIRSMSGGNDKSDRQFLRGSLEGILGNFADNPEIREHLEKFEKCIFRESILTMGEKKLSIFDGRLLSNSPMLLVTEMFASFWDDVMDYFLKNLTIEVFDKRNLVQKEFFTTNESDIFQSIAAVDRLLKKDKKEYQYYLGKLFKSLTKLGDSISIEEYPDLSLISVSIMKNGVKQNISHFGTGHYYLTVMYMKLLSTLQKGWVIDWDTLPGENPTVEKIRCNSERTFVLVEPESFLHPSAQVQLANMIAYFVQLGLRVVIESHSEHFIRSFQLAIAKGEINSELVNLYYFENKDFTQIRRINIDKRGFLLDKFGEGFIDETPRLIQEFFRVNRN